MNTSSKLNDAGTVEADRKGIMSVRATLAQDAARPRTPKASRRSAAWMVVVVHGSRSAAFLLLRASPAGATGGMRARADRSATVGG